MIMDLSGVWSCEIPGCSAPMVLPGTLDENRIGFPDDPAEAMRIGCMQACYLPCAWLLLSSLRRPRQRHDDRQEED